MTNAEKAAKIIADEIKKNRIGTAQELAERDGMHTHHGDLANRNSHFPTSDRHAQKGTSRNNMVLRCPVTKIFQTVESSLTFLYLIKNDKCFSRNDWNTRLQR